MSLLLDTHAFLWWLDGDPQLSLRARVAIAEPATQVFVSAASAWEITAKARKGKLPGATAVAADVLVAIRSQRFSPLDISVEDAQRSGALTGDHADPFDRMLIAQALRRGLGLVSNERLFDEYGVERIW